MTNDRLTIAQQVALRLLECGAVRIQVEKPFTWTSGWKSPIYCDNRLTLSFPEIRRFLKNTLVAFVRATFPDVEAVAGVATAGIPQGALLADALDLPFLYVRSSPKGHGLENLIEGKTKSGAKIVVIEDLISTGGSSLKAALALRKEGYQVMGLVATFTYGFDTARHAFQEAQLPFYALSDYSTLVELLKQQGKVTENQLFLLQQWRSNPEKWGSDSEKMS